MGFGCLGRGTARQGKFPVLELITKESSESFFPTGLSSRMDSSLSGIMGHEAPVLHFSYSSSLFQSSKTKRHSSCLMEDLQEDRLYNFPAENTSMLLSTQALKRTSLYNGKFSGYKLSIFPCVGSLWMWSIFIYF